MKKKLKYIYKKVNNNYLKDYLFKKEYEYFNECEYVLDLGCGTGEFVSYDKKIIGIDSNRKSVEIAKKNKLNVRYGLVTRIPFKKNTFDGVHISHVIEHLYPKDAYKMLSEASRVLKKNGILVLSTPIMWKGFYNDFTHIKPYNPESILRYLVDEGQNKTLDDISVQYEKVDLYWRYYTLPMPIKRFYFISAFLYKYGLHSISKNAYTLVLKKK